MAVFTLDHFELEEGLAFSEFFFNFKTFVKNSFTCFRVATNKLLNTGEGRNIHTEPVFCCEVTQIFVHVHHSGGAMELTVTRNVRFIVDHYRLPMQCLYGTYQHQYCSHGACGDCSKRITFCTQSPQPHPPYSLAGECMHVPQTLTILNTVLQHLIPLSCHSNHTCMQGRYDVLHCCH